MVSLIETNNFSWFWNTPAPEKPSTKCYHYRICDVDPGSEKNPITSHVPYAYVSLPFDQHHLDISEGPPLAPPGTVVSPSHGWLKCSPKTRLCNLDGKATASKPRSSSQQQRLQRPRCHDNGHVTTATGTHKFDKFVRDGDERLTFHHWWGSILEKNERNKVQI